MSRRLDGRKLRDVIGVCSSVRGCWREKGGGRWTPTRSSGRGSSGGTRTIATGSSRFTTTASFSSISQPASSSPAVRSSARALLRPVDGRLSGQRAQGSGHLRRGGAGLLTGTVCWHAHRHLPQSGNGATTDGEAGRQAIRVHRRGSGRQADASLELLRSSAHVRPSPRGAAPRAQSGGYARAAGGSSANAPITRCAGTTGSSRGWRSQAG